MPSYFVTSILLKLGCIKVLIGDVTLCCVVLCCVVLCCAVLCHVMFILRGGQREHVGGARRRGESQAGSLLSAWSGFGSHTVRS